MFKFEIEGNPNDITCRYRIYNHNYTIYLYPSCFSNIEKIPNDLNMLKLYNNDICPGKLFTIKYDNNTNKMTLITTIKNGFMSKYELYVTDYEYLSFREILKELLMYSKSIPS